MDTSRWVYIVLTMQQETNEPLVRFVSLDENKAHEFMKNIDNEDPMFYIQELQ